MRAIFIFTLPILALVLTGCSAEKPIAEGKPVSGVIYENPLSLGGSNRASKINSDSHVAVYSTLIVITSSSGSKQIIPLDYVADLEIE